MNNFVLNPANWNISEVEYYFKNYKLYSNNIIKLSPQFSEEDNLKAHEFFAKWYFHDTSFKNNLTDDLFKTTLTHANISSEFNLSIYFPLLTDNFLFGLHFKIINSHKVFQIGINSTQEFMLKSLNNYFSYNKNSRSIIIFKEKHASGHTLYFNFFVKNNELFGLNTEYSQRLHEFDLQSIEIEENPIYIDTNDIVIDYEIDNALSLINLNLLNK